MMRMRRPLLILAICLGGLLALPSAALAAFGINEFDVRFTAPDGSEVTQAGAHPFAMTTSFNVNSEATKSGTFPFEQVKDVLIAQVPGFVGNQTAVPACPGLGFLHIGGEKPGAKLLPDCSNSSVVGVANVLLRTRDEIGSVTAPLYNLQPSPGKPAKLGFYAEGVPVTIDVALNGAPPYNLIAESTNISQALEFLAANITIWGVPGASVHDEERGTCLIENRLQGAGHKCPMGVPVKPFLTLPTACRGPLITSYLVDSWKHPGAFVSGAAVTHDVATPQGMTGCAALRFEPSIRSQPTTSSGESPSGLDFDLDVSDPGLVEPGGVAGSDIEKAVVTLPEGMTTNPAVVSGLEACSLAQYQAEHLGSSDGCPGASKVGTVEVETPLLGEEDDPQVLRVLHGSIYVAKQHDNPFDNLLTIYMVIEDPKTGIFIKLAGKVEPNLDTGRLTTTFADLPELPFSHFHLHFRDGKRAPLITPAGCGSARTEALLYPYARPDAPVARSATFTIKSAAGGGPCTANLPFSPRFSAGTLAPTAGAYSPFVLRLTRSDGSQQLRSISTTLPKGLLGRLAGIPYCSEGQIAAAMARSGEGQGAAELASPSCPRSSEVGTVTVASGAGPEPYYVGGHAYLAGPYKGAPLSLVIVTPAIAGPFDLGAVTVRTALQVDEKTAQVTAVSDPIPTILFGLPLDVRSIAIDMDRPQFTLNPTSCEPMAIVGSATSTQGASAALSQRFQVGGCRRLRFKPRVKLKLKGATKRAGHPALKAIVTYPKRGAYANIARAQVGLPHSEFLDQGNIGTVCTQPQLKSRTCPKRSIYGHAKAWTPLLDKPLEGPVYLGVGYGHKLPDLVADLDGQIRILLNGRVDTTKRKGIRSTFEAVPDAPVSRFVLKMKGGKKYGLLENSENICRKTQRASARFIAQNGRVAQLHPRIANSCKKRKKRKAHRHHHRGLSRKRQKHRGR